MSTLDNRQVLLPREEQREGVFKMGPDLMDTLVRDEQWMIGDLVT